MKSSNNDKQHHNSRKVDQETPRPQRLMMPLEPRFMFDAAGLLTAVDLQSDEITEQTAPAQTSASDNESDDSLLVALTDTQPAGTSSEIVFVDTSVTNYELLLEGIDPAAEVVLLDANADGLTQIADALQGRSDISAVHIISHGEAGELRLGDAVLTLESMTADYEGTLSAIGEALSEDADILIYGCNFAEGEAGRLATDALAAATGADVAASTDLTGHVDHDGNWELEYQSGAVESSNIITETIRTEWRHLLMDADGDGIGDDTDIDDDNDGITDTEEGFETVITFTPDPLDVNGNGATASMEIDLSGRGLSIGDTVTISNVLANGDLNGFNEEFNLTFNGTLIGTFDTGAQFEGLEPLDQDLDPGNPPVDELELTVIAITGGAPGIEVEIQSSANVDDFAALGYGVRLLFDVSYVTNIDTDGDGIDDYLDIDSDNDGITDNIEAQATGSIILPSGIAAGITDNNNDGLDDNYGTGLDPIDTDGDLVDDYRDADSDDDGVDDIAERGDGQPITLTSTTDTDGDGLVDIFEGGTTSDQDVNDDNLIFGNQINLADTDDDLAIDGSDAMGTIRNLDFRENTLLDIDEDLVDNTEDLDADNDGIANVDEGAPASNFLRITTSTFTVAPGPVTEAPFNIDLSGTGFSIGDTITIDNFQANGDLNQSGEHFGLVFNSGDASETASLDMATNQQFQGLVALTTPVSKETKVIDIGSGTPGITVIASTPAEVDDLGFGFGVQYQFDISGTIGSALDSDGDGLPDYLDIDSDNDGITDNIEAQATGSYTAPSGFDTDEDGIDDAYDVGDTGLVPVDTDGDGVDDVLDLDSDADGVGDIAERRDGQATTLSSLTDTDSDGLLDIFEGSNVNDKDPNDQNLYGEAFALADTDGDLDATWSNASQPQTDLDFREGDFDGDGVLNADDLDADNDGILNTAEGLVETIFNSPNIDAANGPNTSNYTIDLSSTTLNIGDSVEITNFQGDGDLDNAGVEVITSLVFNSGQQTLNNLQTFEQFQGLTELLFSGGGSISDLSLTVIDIGNGTPGIEVSISVNAEVDQFGGNAYSARVTFDIRYDQPTDSDGDGFFDHLDIDSDNDGITDNVEAQTTDAYEVPNGVDGNGVPLIYSGGLDTADLADTDGDTTPDVLDNDSDADGLADIAERGDGQPTSITSTTDSDSDGLLDIFEGSSTIDIDANDENLSGTNFLLSDADDDTAANGNGATPLIQDLDFRDDLRDIDGDSFPNFSDPDADGDGILNALDGEGVDTDSDGIEDWLDIDSDNDGITDNIEAQTTLNYTPPSGVDTAGGADGVDDAYTGGLSLTDTDGDLTADVDDPDSDGDGIDDIAERGDGQPRSIISTQDVDADGLLDIFEGSVAADIDPNDENYNDGAGEFNLADTDNDTNADGGNAAPTATDFDYRDLADTDGDGIENINDIDADNDGILNINEGEATDTDTDGDGVFDYLDLDSDNDGLSDLYESGASTAIINADVNNDGMISRTESGTLSTQDDDNDGLVGVFDNNEADQSTGASIGTVPASTADGDGIADFRDLDSDGDGIADTVEFRATSGFTSNDGDVRDDDEDGDGVIAQFDSNDHPTTGTFGGSFSNVAVDTDADGTPDYRDTNSDDDLAAGNDATESGFTFSSTDANGDGIDDNASIGVSFADPDGTIGNPTTDLPNQFGDTSEIAFRERAFGAVADTSTDEVNESTGATLSATLIANDTFDDASGQTLYVESITVTAGTTLVPAVGTVDITTDRGAIITIQRDGTLTYNPNNQTIFNELDFGDAPVEDTFTYTLSYGGAQTSTASVTVSVSSNNQFSLDSLTGDNGQTIEGAAGNDQAGFQVKAIGDVNGDGYDDVAISAVTASPGGNNFAGAVYVLYGKASGFGAVLSLSSIAAGAGTDGFVLNGIDESDRAGRAITGGDINGDGFSDVIISASTADTPNGESSGEIYVLYGRDNAGFSTLLGGTGSYDLSGLATGGTDGFTIRGIAANDNAGRSVAYAGDVNGDGFGDFLISGHFADTNGANAGDTYLILGQSTADFTAALTSGVFELSGLAGGGGADGVVFTGTNAGDYAGQFVAGGGDFNGDGFDDIAIGALYSAGYDGTAYVVFGQANFGAGTVALSSLTGSNGFAVTGPTDSYAGTALSLAGDLNGDGFDDLVVSAPGNSPNGQDFSGTTYVIFGQSAAMTASEPITNSPDVVINGALSAYNSAGFALDSSGDINGDGFDDLLLGRGPFEGIDAGAVYVVFGDTGLTGTIELTDLIPVTPSLPGGSAGSTVSTGFTLSGVDFDSYAGQALATGGDINGDGFDDLIIGAYAASPNGTYSGEAYLVFGTDFSGENPTVGTSGDDLLLGGTGSEVLIGGDGNDYLDGAGNNDVLLGGNGDDDLIFDPLDTLKVDGGGGSDTLDFTDSSGVLLDLTLVPDTVYRDIEVIDLTGAGDNTLRLSTAELLAMSGTSNVLTINGNAGDVVQMVDFATLWTSQGTDGEGYEVYTNGEATIRIQPGVSIINAAVIPEASQPEQSDGVVADSDGAGSDERLALSEAGEKVAPFSEQLSTAADRFNAEAQKLLVALLD